MGGVRIRRVPRPTRFPRLRGGDGAAVVGQIDGIAAAVRWVRLAFYVGNVDVTTCIVDVFFDGPFEFTPVRKTLVRFGGFDVVGEE